MVGFGFWCVAYGCLLAWAKWALPRRVYVRLWAVGVFATVVIGFAL